jgi:hypothetical protein
MGGEGSQPFPAERREKKTTVLKPAWRKLLVIERQSENKQLFGWTLNAAHDRALAFANKHGLKYNQLKLEGQWGEIENDHAYYLYVWYYSKEELDE